MDTESRSVFTKGQGQGQPEGNVVGDTVSLEGTKCLRARSGDCIPLQIY